jgi:tetratricopeptide (TPR) repeat protein
MGSYILGGLVVVVIVLWLATIGTQVLPTWLVGPARRAIFRLRRSRAADAVRGARIALSGRVRRANGSSEGGGEHPVRQISEDERLERARTAIDRLRRDEPWMPLDYPRQPFEGRTRERLAARAENALALPPEEFDDADRIALANALVRVDRPAEAIPFLDTVVATYPQDATLRHNRGVALLMGKRYAEAVSDLRPGSERKDPSISDLWALGDAYAGAGMNDEALATFDRGIKVMPDATHVALRRAHLLSEMGRHQTAVAAVAELPRHLRSHNWTRNLVAANQEALGDESAALRTLEQALARDPHDIRASWTRARLLHLAGDREGALRDLETLLSVAPENARGLVFRGHLLIEMERSEEGVADTRRAANLAPEDSFVQTFAARNLFSVGAKEEALMLAGQAVDAAREDPKGAGDLTTALRLRTSILVDLGRYAEAERSARAVLVQCPDDASVMLLLAVTLARLGRAEEARGATDEGLAMSPNRDSVYNAACAMSLLGDLDRALELLTSALDRGGDVEWAAKDPDFEALRNDPRTAAGMASLLERTRVARETGQEAGKPRS